MNMRYYRGTFTKANGELRTMFFVRPEDLPNEFITENTNGNGNRRALKEGQETVWDLKVGGWRTFNWKTADIEEIQTFETDENILNKFIKTDV